MKFSKKIEEIKNREENKGKIVLIRCGIFFIATGNILYDYEKNTKQLIPKYQYDGGLNTEEKSCKQCNDCPSYKGCTYSNINIYELLQQRKEKQQEDEQ